MNDPPQSALYVGRRVRSTQIERTFASDPELGDLGRIIKTLEPEQPVDAKRYLVR